MFLLLYFSFMATFIVTTSADSGPGSLREAILAANRTAGSDEILFDLPDGLQVISLTSALPEISDAVTIRNTTGAANLTIERASTAPNFRILSIQPGVTVQLDQLTLTNGNAGTGNGGAIANRGNLTINNSVITGNQAVLGGGILNALSGSLTINNSTIDGNRASAPTSTTTGGGGVENQGTLRVNNSTFSNNQVAAEGVGGAISNSGGTLIVVNSTFSGNQAGGNGGAIRNSGTATLTNVTLTNNTADANGNGQGSGGGLQNAGLITLRNTLVAGNFDTPNNAGPQATTPDVAGNFLQATSANLIGDGTGSNLVDGVNDNRVGSSTSRIDPRLGPLANNGGLTLTHLLLADSPAINAGSNSLVPADLETDQRGEGFPRILEGRVDIGAIEYRFIPIPGVLSFTSPSSNSAEGTIGNSEVIVGTVQRTGGTDGTVTVEVALVGGTATPGTDFVNVFPLTLTFAEGETLKDVTLALIGDRIIEADETLTLQLVNPTGGATIGQQATTTFTILNDDFPGSLSFSLPANSVAEGDRETVATPIATVERRGGSSGEVTVRVELVSSTATPGVDFENIFPLTVTFADGETSKTVSLPLIGDTLTEADEVLVLQLANPTGGATLGGLTRTTITILNDDFAAGTPNDDVIIGTPGPDVLGGEAGNDIIDGRGGDDLLVGGSDRGIVTTVPVTGVLGRPTPYTNTNDPANGLPAFVREWLIAAENQGITLSGTNLAGTTTRYTSANPPTTLGLSPTSYASTDGIGVAGAFAGSIATIQAEINYDPNAPEGQVSSEVFTIQWATDVTDAYLDLSFFFSKEGEGLGTEVGLVRAFRDGQEVDITGTRMEDRTTRSTNQSSVNRQGLGVEFTADRGDGDYRLAVTGLFDTLVLTAKPYIDVTSPTAITIDSSDYLIQEVVYQSTAVRVTNLQFGDVLRGGIGNDTFRFGRGDGVDLITDFGTGDRIDVRGYQPSDLILLGTTALFRNGSSFEAITSVGQTSYRGSGGNVVQLVGNGRVWRPTDFVFS